MRIAISAASGLVGGALAQALEQRGDTVLRLVRGAATQSGLSVRWEPARESLEREKLEGVDAVVHLSGEPVANGRWTAEKKRRILTSREQSTRFLCGQLAQLQRKPSVFVCASAIGIYGDRSDEILDETSAPGTGFLAEVCQRWEAACVPARDAGIRVVNVRIGIVLSAKGGALAKMLTPFRLGLGGRLGDGRACMSWITLEDLVRVFIQAINDTGLEGPINAVAPDPVTNAAFTSALGRALHRPALLPVPAFLLHAALGEMADEMLLASTRAVPAKLERADFRFKHERLDSALADSVRPVGD